MMVEKLSQEKKRKQFPGNKNFESIIITKTENLGHNEETYYDIRIFNSDSEDKIYPTKKGVTIPARTLKRMTLFLLNDLMNCYVDSEWDFDLPISDAKEED